MKGKSNNIFYVDVLLISFLLEIYAVLLKNSLLFEYDARWMSRWSPFLFQESPFVPHFNDFFGLGAPSQTFTSTPINSHHKTQFLSTEISQNENKTRVTIEDTRMFITDNMKDFDRKNDAHNQNSDVLFSQSANEPQGGYDSTRQTLQPLQDLREREYYCQREGGIHASAENTMQLADHGV